MQVVYARCAGLDVHQKTVSACVIVCEPDGKKRRQVRALCANMCETSRPWTITVGRGKKSHFDEHKQDKHFFRCVGSFGA